MDTTTDIKIHGPAPPPEKQQAIERDFVEKAKRAGAIDAYIVKKAGHWSFVAEFVDTEKAARFAGKLTNATGTELSSVNLKPPSNDLEN